MQGILIELKTCNPLRCIFLSYLFITFLDFLQVSSFLCYSLIFFLPIFTCNMAMKSYRHLDHASFMHFKKSKKWRLSDIFQPVLAFPMTMESYWLIDYTSFVNFSKSHKMKAVDQKDTFAKSYFCSRAFIFEIFKIDKMA